MSSFYVVTILFASLQPFVIPLCTSHPHRAGFAEQGAKQRQLLKENNAFNVSSFVLRAMMSGQYWPEGDEVYHAELTVPILLVHGMHDKFVPIEEDQRMAEVEHRAAIEPGQEQTIVVIMTASDTLNLNKLLLKT